MREGAGLLEAPRMLTPWADAGASPPQPQAEGTRGRLSETHGGLSC